MGEYYMHQIQQKVFTRWLEKEIIYIEYIHHDFRRIARILLKTYIEFNINLKMARLLFRRQ